MTEQKHEDACGASRSDAGLGTDGSEWCGELTHHWRCDDCRAVGALHCANPDECGGMKQVPNAELTTLKQRGN